MVSLFNLQDKQAIVDIMNIYDNEKFTLYCMENNLIKQSNTYLSISKNRQNEFKKKNMKLKELKKEDFTYEFLLECVEMDLLDYTIFEYYDNFHFDFGIVNSKLENIFLKQIVSKVLEKNKNINNIPEKILQNKYISDYLINYICDNTALVTFIQCDNCKSYYNNCCNRDTNNDLLRINLDDEFNLTYVKENNYKFGIYFDVLPLINSFQKYESIGYIETYLKQNKMKYIKWWGDGNIFLSSYEQNKLNKKKGIFFDSDNVNMSFVYDVSKYNKSKTHIEFRNKICILLSNRKMKENNKKIHPDIIKLFNLKFDFLQYSDEYITYYIKNCNFQNNEKNQIYDYVCERKKYELMALLITKSLYIHNDFIKYTNYLDDTYYKNAFDNNKLKYFSEIPQKYHSNYYLNKLVGNVCINDRIPIDWTDFDPNSEFGEGIINFMPSKITNKQKFFNLIKKIKNEDKITECLTTLILTRKIGVLNVEKIKNFIDFNYENDYGYIVLKVMIKNSWIDDKKILYDLIIKNIPQYLIDEIVKSTILFDYYDYNPSDDNGYIFLTKMIQNKNYRLSNTIINFIESSKNPTYIFKIAIDNQFLQQNQVKPKFVISVYKQEKNCIACFEEIKEIYAIIPCGHTDLCPKCYENIKKKTCPICTNVIKEFNRIYM